MMNNKMRFGIVGCGVIGPTHARAIDSLPDAELVAVADRNVEQARSLAQTYGATAYGTLEEMLEREDLDIVNVCTASGVHGRQACQIMRTGRHVIVEKPMEITLKAIDEMLEVQQENGVKLAVISQHRFDAASLRVRGLIEESAFGRLVLGNADVPWWRSQDYYDSGAWRGTRELDGGGILMNQSIHSIDLLQWFMGPVHSVFAYTDTRVHRMETEDLAVAVLRFQSGALGTIAATTGAYPGVASRIEVFGDRGSAVIENDEMTCLRLARDDTEDVGPYGLSIQPAQAAKSSGAAADPGDVVPEGHARQIADMIRAVREDRTPLLDGHAARHPVAIILGIYESARRHKEVEIT
jgi:UDP-N-acetyl-2-amino-2-deoxyglucuronate dehydrogenase